MLLLLFTGYRIPAYRRPQQVVLMPSPEFLREIDDEEAVLLLNLLLAGSVQRGATVDPANN